MSESDLKKSIISRVMRAKNLTSLEMANSILVETGESVENKNFPLPEWVLEKIDIGLQQAKNGLLTDDADAEKELDLWLAKSSGPHRRKKTARKF